MTAQKTPIDPFDRDGIGRVAACLLSAAAPSSVTEAKGLVRERLGPYARGRLIERAIRHYFSAGS